MLVLCFLWGRSREDAAANNWVAYGGVSGLPNFVTATAQKSLDCICSTQEIGMVHMSLIVPAPKFPGRLNLRVLGRLITPSLK